jgi:hypothetical protein
MKRNCRNDEGQGKAKCLTKQSGRKMLVYGTMQYYAHSLPDQPPEKWQLLEDHLKNVKKT